MTQITHIRNEIETSRVIAIVRSSHGKHITEAVDVIAGEGIRIVEISLNTPSPFAVIESVAAKFAGAMAVGAGTVLDEVSARLAIDAGAQFLVTPNLDESAIRCGSRYGVPVIAGALTSTEAVRAVCAGAAYVKVFPASLGGPSYVKELMGPIPQLGTIPTGGIQLENAQSFLDAGAVAIAVGSGLMHRKILEEKDWDTLRARAAQFSQLCIRR